MTKLTEVKNLNIKIKILKDNLDEKSEEEQFQLPDPSIVFFDSVEKFKALARNISWNSNLHQHLVYVPGLTISDIIETLSDGFLIDEVNFLMNETLNSIDLVTSFMFTEQACRVQQLKTINRFNSNTSKWDGSIFYPKKYQNFHDCELTISKVEGIHSGVFHLMELIFETGLNAFINEAHQECIDSDDCDLTSIQSFLLPLDFKSYVLANPHAFDTYTYIVPPGEPYTDLERMFMMFDTETWIAISATLLIGLLATLSLHFVSTKVRNIIAGRDIQSPTMNLISIFLSGGQVTTPRGFFARFLFTLFLMWSLIIRTCHQSMLFELMQADLRRPPISTFDELFESDLTIHDEMGAENGSIQLDEYFKERMAMSSTRFVTRYLNVAFSILEL